ncbi:sensor histidine kinase [Cognatishimia maritima]|uniref:histidine kinase n=1 Tax=Cognatishimia maritima TaxID=870908 RepID=A0A1M5IRB9_9RHOB|nr:ATP-binding protein [Cognatishimia maritima]SHG30888.1 two-component system, OmpR family, phosphate regulon sensor histidine kinase PhoR [Cognatishimia maritima]
MINSLLDAIPLPAIFVGTDARLMGANAQAKALQPNAQEGRTLVLIFRQPGLNAAIESCLHRRTPQRAIYLHSEDGQETRYDVSCSFVEIGGTAGVLACFKDITEVEQAGEIRREFVANVSHELKTPLTALLGFIETLQGPAKNDAQARERFLGIMDAEANRMNRLVGDLLSLSRVEEDARMRPSESLDICEILSTVVRNLDEVAKSRGHEIVLHQPDSPVTLPADRDQLMQVFINLIENAVKYGGRDGQVTISVEPVERDQTLRKPAVRISIADTGPGIDAVHIPRLTERFYRIDSHRSREMGGTGLGLAIVKHIVARHRGRMKIESSLGQGSTFTVILPKN